MEHVHLSWSRTEHQRMARPTLVTVTGTATWTTFSQQHKVSHLLIISCRLWRWNKKMRETNVAVIYTFIYFDHVQSVIVVCKVCSLCTVTQQQINTSAVMQCYVVTV